MGKWLKKHLVNLILVAMILAGAGLLAYPTFSDRWNSYHQTRAIESYTSAVANLSREEYARIIESAEEYNRNLTQTSPGAVLTGDEARAYNSELSVEGSGIMGYIDLPKINIKLPVYHGTDEAVLQVAIGHLAGTSLPVGGAGTHCVLSGHRGLPSARLFTDLDKIAEGDTWTLTVLDRTYTYMCDQIRVVEPWDMSELAIEAGRDYCTLVTCTPYGINTHRLLVRGHRISNAHGDAAVLADALLVSSDLTAVFFAIPLLLVTLVWIVLSSRRARRKLREQRERTQRSEERIQQRKPGTGEHLHRQERRQSRQRAGIRGRYRSGQMRGGRYRRP